MGIKLKPCPFCGGEADSGFGSVNCYKCNARIELFRPGDTAEAIAAWNTRSKRSLLINLLLGGLGGMLAAVLWTIAAALGIV